MLRTPAKRAWCEFVLCNPCENSKVCEFGAMRALRNSQFPILSRIHSQLKQGLPANLSGGTPQVGIEPTTQWLTAICSTAELLRIKERSQVKKSRPTALTKATLACEASTVAPHQIRTQALGTQRIACQGSTPSLPWHELVLLRTRIRAEQVRIHPEFKLQPVLACEFRTNLANSGLLGAKGRVQSNSIPHSPALGSLARIRTKHAMRAKRCLQSVIACVALHSAKEPRVVVRK